MSAHEMGHEGHGAPDPAGQRIGILASVLAVCLTLVTIASHRAHTHGIALKSEANDQWAYYQSKKIKGHTLELGIDMIGVLGAHGEAAEKMVQKYQGEKERYARESESIKGEAEHRDKESKHEEKKALFFDLSEGIFEVALILTSIFFLSRKKLFPRIGVAAGLGGLVVGILGLLA